MPINWTNSARYANYCHTPGNTGKDTLISLFAQVDVQIECGAKALD